MGTIVEDGTAPANIIVSRRERQARPHCLEQQEGPESGRSFPLDVDEFIIGRSEQANVVVASPRASRRHAVIRRVGEEFVMEDLNSRNGVLLNGIRVHSAELRTGDLIQVAECVFVFASL